MPIWTLTIITKDGQEYRVVVGKDESSAVRALDEARQHIGTHGTVTIVDRLALPAEDIASAQIVENRSRSASY